MQCRIITEQICEVETQVIVFEQFRSSINNWRSDLSRENGRQSGYDSNIAGRYSQIQNSDGTLSTNDMGFNGQSVGQNTVVPGGSNWNNNTSPASVASAMQAARSAVNATSLFSNNTNAAPAANVTAANNATAVASNATTAANSTASG